MLAYWQEWNTYLNPTDAFSLLPLDIDIEALIFRGWQESTIVRVIYTRVFELFVRLRTKESDLWWGLA